MQNDAKEQAGRVQGITMDGMVIRMYQDGTVHQCMDAQADHKQYRGYRQLCPRVCMYMAVLNAFGKKIKKDLHEEASQNK